VDYCVTLIHGTFARRARWTRDDSTFCESLKAQLKASSLVLSQFDWSGWNSPGARGRAAQRLATELESTLVRYPGARQFVIGHSHGGAVALKAVTVEPGLRKRIAGVATLSTPFVHLRERTPSGFVRADMLTWIFVLPLAAVAGVGSFFLRAKFRVVDNIPLSFGLAVAEGLLALVVATAAARQTIRLATRVRLNLECGVPPGFNLLVVRSSGDEASAFLAMSQLMTWLVGRLSRVAAWALLPSFWVLSALRRAGRWLPAIILVLLFSLLSDLIAVNALMDGLFGPSAASHNEVKRFANDFLGAIRQAIASPSGDNALELFGRSIIILGASIAVLPALVWLALAILAVVVLPLGAESVLAALFVDPSVECVPEGSWTVHQFLKDEPPKAGIFRLAHSEAYSDPRVISLLASWMQQPDQATGIATPPALALNR